jgi:hypothetical protein
MTVVTVTEGRSRRHKKMKLPTKCSECGGPFEAGFIPDNAYYSQVHLHWHPGPAESGSFLGIPTGTKVPGPTYAIRALRCSGCGLIRLYSEDKPSA